MSTRTDTLEESPVIETRDQLISVFAKGEKPSGRWRIGTEHEKFVYRTADHHAPSYDEPGGIRDLLAGLIQRRFGSSRAHNACALGFRWERRLGICATPGSMRHRFNGVERLPRAFRGPSEVRPRRKQSCFLARRLISRHGKAPLFSLIPRRTSELPAALDCN